MQSSYPKISDNRCDREDIYLDIFGKIASGAASFVGGGSINGWEKWQTDDGKSLKDIMPK